MQERISLLCMARLPVEPVAAGANRAACSCRYVNVLAHPGLITPESAHLAAKNRVALELTSRGGHDRTNGHVPMSHGKLAATARCLTRTRMLRGYS